MKKLATRFSKVRHGFVDHKSVGMALFLVAGLMLPIWPLSTAAAAAEPWVAMDWNMGGSYRNVAFTVSVTGSGLKVAADESLPWAGAYGCTIPAGTIVYDFTQVGKDSAGNNLYNGSALQWTASGGVCSMTGLGGKWSAVLKPGQNGFLTPKLEFGNDHVIGVYPGTYKAGDSMPLAADNVLYRKGGTTPTATSSPSTGAITYTVGDTGPGGGLIFFVGLKNEYPGFMYLEAAPSDIPGTFLWCSDSSHSISAVSGPEAWVVGRGQVNTNTMLSACSSGAANAAHAYTNNGKSDWFLPSRDELKLMYTNIHSSSVFTSGDYWSSSQNDVNFAWVQHFVTDGNAWATDKSFARYVRPVRAFSTLSVATPKPTVSIKFVKPSSITCIKGKLIKKVTAKSPKCPKGYKKK